MPPRITRRCAVPSCGQTQSLHGLPCDPNIRKEWMNFIFDEVPDHVSKTLFVCSLHFSADAFLNKTQFDAGFSERLKIKNDAVPTILNPTVMLQRTAPKTCREMGCQTEDPNTRDGECQTIQDLKQRSWKVEPKIESVFYCFLLHYLFRYT